MDYLSFINKLSNDISSRYPILSPIDNLVPDGKVKRFDSTKNGDKVIWIVLNQFEYKGNVFYSAVYGNWRYGQEFTINSFGRNDYQNKEFNEKQKQILKEAKDNLKDEKIKKHKACRDKWEPIYYNSPTASDTHPYLLNKKIDSNYHAKIGTYGDLMVPLWNSKSEFTGLQKIFFDLESNNYIKRFTTGIELEGSFCPFGDVRNAEIIYIAEGFATAASIYMAFKKDSKKAVIAAFTANNLFNAAVGIRAINSNSYIVFCADKDVNVKPELNDIGFRKAKQASNKLSNAIARCVIFSINNSEWTDFNDLHQYEGIEKVQKQLTVDISEFVEIIPLGFNSEHQFYYSTSRKQILKWKSNDHTINNFVLNAPRKYWGDRYGYVTKTDGEISTEPDWKRVIETLGKEINKAGIFDYDAVRGVGVWKEKEEIAVNLGDKIFYKGQYCQLFKNEINSKHYYESGKAVSFDFNIQASNEDCLKIIEAFKMLKYKNSGDYIIFLGWIYCAQIFSCIPWRPHLWITGPSGAGKSTILQYIKKMVKFSTLTVNSTVIGIKQRIKNSTKAIISDESEPTEEKSRERLKAVIEFIRETSTQGDYESLRGSNNGKYISYDNNAIFCMGSVQLSQMGSPDTSRFFVVEMKSVSDQSDEDFNRLDSAMGVVAGFADALFVRSVVNYHTFLENIKIAKSEIKRRKLTPRQADQVSAIIAGYYAYHNTGLITQEFIGQTINDLNLLESDYIKSNEENDSEKCYGHIMDIQVPGKQLTIGQILEIYSSLNTLQKADYNTMLGLFGIRYLEKENQIFIPVSSGLLKNSLERISPYSDYSNVLKRHEKFVETKQIKMAGKNARGLILKCL